MNLISTQLLTYRNGLFTYRLHYQIFKNNEQFIVKCKELPALEITGDCWFTCMNKLHNKLPVENQMKKYKESKK